MAIRMVSLVRAKNGDWFARKEIPKDIRAAYKQAHGISQEERFRRPGSLPPNRAKQELREWDAEVSAKIAALRAAESGEGRSLTQREAMGLAGDWYVWFTAPHEEHPGEPEHWEITQATFEDTLALPPNRQRARVAELARLPSFLAERGEVLAPDAYELFQDAVKSEFGPACALLRRRAEGDFGRDRHREKFPPAARAAGLTCWTLFNAWVKERQPAASTVDRWRSVFLALEGRFPARDIATITDTDAIEWKDTLVTPERTARVVNEVWLAAAKTVFGWALKNKKIAGNPFKSVVVAARRKKVRNRGPEFTEQECQTILSAALAPPPTRLAPHHAHARRWVPWLCGYTGSRAGEITQLRAEDVVRENGIWAVRITPEAGTVKGGSARTVPIHEHLIEQGFLEFVKGRKGPLFYDPIAARAVTIDPSNPRKGPWTKTRDKLAEWVRAIGVKDKDLSPNHAWRHTFKRRATRAKIEPGIRDAICGHASRTIADDYETPSLDDMAAALKSFPRYQLQ